MASKKINIIGHTTKLQQRHIKEQIDFIKNDKRRMLHSVFNIAKAEDTKSFYTNNLGMKILRERNVPKDGYYNLFFGYGPEKSNFALEVTYNYDKEKYDLGNGFDHYGVVVDNVKSTCSKIGCAKDNTVKDPTGYVWELIERPQKTNEPFAEITLNVQNIEKSIEYYTQALGLRLLNQNVDPEKTKAQATLGYGEQDSNTVIVLEQHYDHIGPYSKGDGYTQVAFSTNDVYKTAEIVRQLGYQIVKEPGPVLDGTKIFQTVDPDGYKYAFVDNADFEKEL